MKGRRKAKKGKVRGKLKPDWEGLNSQAKKIWTESVTNEE